MNNARNDPGPGTFGFELSQNRYFTALAIAYFSIASAADAVDLELLSPNAMKTVLNDLIPRFEQASGHRVTISYTTASTLVKEIEDGKVADVASQNKLNN